MKTTGYYLRNYCAAIILLLGVRSLAAQDCVTNILIAYSVDAADSLGGDSLMVDAIVRAAGYMNTIYVYSDVAQQTALVRTVRLNYPEVLCFAEDLNAFQKSSYINRLRDRYHADVAVVVLGNDEFCGLPYLDNTVATDTTAYCAVNFYCMMTNFAVSHQVAHLYGCAHAAEIANDDSGSVYPYGHGYRWVFNDCASFSTIMGVGDDDFCGGNGEEACDLIPYFSNPSLQYNGVDLGVAGINDNARVLNENTSLIGALKLVPATQTELNDTVNLHNIALATARDTLTTGTTYVISDAARVTFQTGQKIVLNPGFSAAEGVRFETVLREPDEACGQ